MVFSRAKDVIGGTDNDGRDTNNNDDDNNNNNR